MKHLPFIEDKPKLKKLQTKSEKQAFEEAGGTDENEEIDKVRRKTGYFLLHVCSIPKLPDIYNTCRIFTLQSAKIAGKQAYLVYETQCIQYEVEMKLVLTIFRRKWLKT